MLAKPGVLLGGRQVPRVVVAHPAYYPGVHPQHQHSSGQLRRGRHQYLARCGGLVQIMKLPAGDGLFPAHPAGKPAAHIINSHAVRGVHEAPGTRPAGIAVFDGFHASMLHHRRAGNDRVAQCHKGSGATARQENRHYPSAGSSATVTLPPLLSATVTKVNHCYPRWLGVQWGTCFFLTFLT